MGGDAGAPECFICTESEPRPHRSACLCTDRYMHTECFVKMLKAQKGEPRCSVCGALYENVSWRTRRIPQLNSLFGLVAMLVCSAIVLLGCAINTLTVVSNRGPSGYVMVWVAILLMILGSIGSLACVVELVRYHSWRAVWTSRYREETAIVLGAVKLPTRTTPVELGLGQLATVDEATVL